MPKAAPFESALSSGPRLPNLLQPWGLRVAYVVDPSGVLCHVAERRKHNPAD
jgi:hypothetical protein